jgi:hypothetical protein
MMRQGQVRSKLKVKVMPVLKLGVDKSLLTEYASPMLCRATAGGSCIIDCTRPPAQ